LFRDDVIVEKAFAQRLPWAGWTYSFAKKRKVYGLHIVVLLWCSGDGHWRIWSVFGCDGPSAPVLHSTIATRGIRSELLAAERGG
jgi:hypothetical protein